MSTVSATKFGNHVRFTDYGEYIKAKDGDGILKGELSVENSLAEPEVTPEELTQLIDYSVAADIESDAITYPPEVEGALGLAASFYETYLLDTGLDRVEVIDRYVTTLIEQLEAAHEDDESLPDEEEVREYVLAVHERAAEAKEATALAA